MGREGAARFYVASLLDSLDVVGETGFPRTVFCTPGSGARELRRLGVAGEIVAQGGGDLGRRMQRALHLLLNRAGIERSLLIGTDSPDLPVATVAEADRALDTAPAVFVPATDGGFALIGLRADTLPCWQGVPLFTGVPWSRPTTLARTMERFSDLGLTPRVLEPWWDVDEPADLIKLRLRLEAQRALGTPCALRTEIALRELLP